MDAVCCTMSANQYIVQQTPSIVYYLRFVFPNRPLSFVKKLEIMSTTTVEKKVANLTVNGKVKRYVTWQEFERRYLSREDGFKYEWNDGIIEKNHSTMNQEQMFILSNLNKFLRFLEIQESVQLGDFPAETNIFLSELVHKKPDLPYFTAEQIDAAVDGKKFIPDFVIEVISPTDNANRVNRKLLQYLAIGIKVIWHIYPEDKVVHVFDNVNKRSKVCQNDDLCSAELVIKGFVLPVSQIFQRLKKNN